GWDEATGLWFPADAPKDVYLSGSDPARSYVADVRKAFQADEALRARVCEALSAPRNEVSARQVGGRVMQLHTMVDMLCVGIPANRRLAEQQEKVDRENRARWRAWLDLARARSLAP